MASDMTADLAMKNCVHWIHLEAQHFGFLIREDLLEALRERFEPRFIKLFAANPEIWETAGKEVEKMARYLGAVAALKADARRAVSVSREDLSAAAAYIKENCPAGVAGGFRLAFCRDIG